MSLIDVERLREVAEVEFADIVVEAFLTLPPLPGVGVSESVILPQYGV